MKIKKWNLVIVGSVILNNSSDGMLVTLEALAKAYNIFIFVKNNETEVSKILEDNGIFGLCEVTKEIPLHEIGTTDIGWIDISLESLESKLFDFSKVVLFTSSIRGKGIPKYLGVAQDWDDVLNHFIRQDSYSHVV
ncbi:MAG: hypothetical protein EOM85_02720 [Candidatus Moranbacteria bacterium]|nr:hypothetical protein [Candidatus Moranbacteria bacterium]